MGYAGSFMSTTSLPHPLEQSTATMIANNSANIITRELNETSKSFRA